MKLWHHTRTGYRYNSILFILPFLLLGALMLNVYLTHGTGWYVYFECNHPIGCENPLLISEYDPDYIKFEYTFTGKKIDPVCKWEWCDMERLPQGVYGEKPPFFVEFSGPIFFGAILLSFLANHLFFNRGVKFDYVVKGSLFEKIVNKLKSIKIEDEE